MIAFKRALQPIRFFNAFISYSHADKYYARHLHDRLQSEGIRCWRDEKDLKIGDHIHESIDNAIRLRDRVILLCSKDSVNSHWVEEELEKTFAKERKIGRRIILPIDLDGHIFKPECTKWFKSKLTVRMMLRVEDVNDMEHVNAGIERVIEALKAEEA